MLYIVHHSNAAINYTLIVMGDTLTLSFSVSFPPTPLPTWERQEEGEGKLEKPTAVHVMGQFVYVSDMSRDQIVVYRTSGQFVTSFGGYGQGEGELDDPYGISSDQSGFIYVADYRNNRVQVY